MYTSHERGSLELTTLVVIGNYRKIYKLECGEDGTWKGDNCVSITCPSPDIVFKGLYRCFDLYNAGSTCTMMCPDNSVGLYAYV
jgi:hypothetical protein